MIPARTLPLLLLPLVLAACSSSAQEGGKGTDDANGASATPPIHVEQTLLDRKDGKVPLEQLYRQALANCQKGTMPVRPLDAETVGKLGRTYVESWYEGARVAVREDRWSYDVDSMCLFRPVHKRSLSIVDAKGSQQIDLDRHTGHFDPDVQLERTPQERATAPHADDNLKAAVAAQLAQQGHAGVMAQDAGQQTEAGQPCKRVHDAAEDICVWTGGSRWGFDEAVGNGPYSVPQRTSIVLFAKPADDGDGQYLSTQKMTVGERFDEGVFSRPSGIAMDRAP